MQETKRCRRMHLTRKEHMDHLRMSGTEYIPDPQRKGKRRKYRKSETETRACIVCVETVPLRLNTRCEDRSMRKIDTTSRYLISH